MSIYRRVLLYYRPFVGSTLLALAISLVTIGLNLLKPVPFKLIIDNVLPGKAHGLLDAWHASPSTQIFALCAFLVLVTLLSGLLGLWGNYVFVRVGLQALLKLRTDLFAYLQSLAAEVPRRRRSGDSSFRVAYDSQSIQTIYNRGFTNIFNSLVTLVAIFLIMLRLDGPLTILSVAIVPAVVWAIHHFSTRIRQQSTSIQELESAVLTTVQEGLSSIKVVHAFGGEQAAVDQFRTHAQRQPGGQPAADDDQRQKRAGHQHAHGARHRRNDLPGFAARPQAAGSRWASCGCSSATWRCSMPPSRR